MIPQSLHNTPCTSYLRSAGSWDSLGYFTVPSRKVTLQALGTLYNVLVIVRKFPHYAHIF